VRLDNQQGLGADSNTHPNTVESSYLKLDNLDLMQGSLPLPTKPEIHGKSRVCCSDENSGFKISLSEEESASFK
jgi:hypothetical protein